MNMAMIDGTRLCAEFYDDFPTRESSRMRIIQLLHPGSINYFIWHDNSRQRAAASTKPPLV